MKTVDCEQGSPEWIAARVGSLGASRLHEAVARTKAGWGASRANLMAELIAERLTGVPAEKFTNAAMVHGTETEPEARAAYEFRQDVEVAQVGLVLHPTIGGTHASPDGLVGNDGLVEIKAPNTSTHIETLLTGAIPAKYVTQMQWQIRCCDRTFCDYVSYDNRMPASMSLFIKRVSRDDMMIASLEKEVIAFLAELRDKIDALKAACGVAEPLDASAEMMMAG